MKNKLISQLERCILSSQQPPQWFRLSCQAYSIFPRGRSHPETSLCHAAAAFLDNDEHQNPTVPSSIVRPTKGPLGLSWNISILAMIEILIPVSRSIQNLYWRNGLVGVPVLANLCGAFDELDIRMLVKENGRQGTNTPTGFKSDKCAWVLEELRLFWISDTQALGSKYLVDN